jgi:DNA helicase II / ATP-dependent DNA helicase PcrA
MNELSVLNPEQKDAVLHTGEPLLILAGAGSGKTRVITSKIAYLISEKKVDPMSILAVTFTNKAANEMKQRVCSTTEIAEYCMIRTFHSFGAWLLRRYSRYINLNSSFTIYDETDSYSLLKQITEKKFTREELKKYCNIISRAKDLCLTPKDDLSSVTELENANDIYRIYQEKLEDIGNADFGDLIMRSVEILSKFPDIKSEIQKRFKIILIDEYQDSNTAQFYLLKQLYSEYNYICVVGDEDQSIYKFRGAEINNILQFPDSFPGTKIIRLEENYRSTQTILNAANSVVEKNRNRLGKNLWTKNPVGSPIIITCLSDEHEEAKFCASILKDNKLSSTAILYRNNFQSRVFESVFLKLGIPYRIIGTVRFFEREEIKDALAYMAFLLNNNDLVSFLRIINKPGRGLGNVSIQKIISQNSENLLSSCRKAVNVLSGKSRKGLNSLITIIEDLSNLIETEPLSKIIDTLIHITGLKDYYLNKDDTENTYRVQNLEELINASLSYPLGLEGLSSFLEDVTLNSSDEDPYTSKNKVNLITIHNTKGLEFERVIITGMEDSLFPYYTDKVFEDDLDLEEERRLFYVGMTRAKKSLFLTTCQRRQVYGTYQDRSPSRFLFEIPSAYTERYTEYSTFNRTDMYRKKNNNTQKAKNSEFTRGCEVFHNDYGTGVIAKTWHDGENEMAEVNFFSGKKAKFILKYSNLEKVTTD